MNERDNLLEPGRIHWRWALEYVLSLVQLVWAVEVLPHSSW